MHREPHVERNTRRAPAPESVIRRVRPFHIRVGDDVLLDLRQRIDRTRWTRSEPDPGWQRGVDPAYLVDLVDHWRDHYDWHAVEASLDERAQFVATVGETDVHFVHERGGGLPLLLLHGWPDSFFRYHAVVPRLAAYDVVVPSLPGFAFTPALPAGERPMRAVASAMHALMTDVLGYSRYGVVGGDGGSVLAQILAIDHPDAVVGIHVTDLGWHAANADADDLTWGERRYLARLKKRFMADGGYAMVQSTWPRSLAGLADSPVGLASWIVDRFHAWSSGDLDRRFGKDTLLTNIMLYWVTQSIGTSMLAYRAEARSPSITVAERVERPVGVALFPCDIGGIPPRRFAERTLAVTRWTEMPRGGHFAALEEPELFARDVDAFFKSL